MSKFEEIKSIHEDTWRNDKMEIGLDNPNIYTKTSKITNIVKYANDIMNYANETEYVNENKPKLWIWKHLKFIFSTGKIYEQTDRVILDKIINYFDKSEKTFIPCEYNISNYENEVIKNLEETYDIDNGNYHIMLIPYVLCSDTNDLKNAPEEIFTMVGPVDAYIDINRIVDYILEINYKYACVISDLPEKTQEYVYAGVPREFGDVEHREYQKKITRKGFDGNTMLMDNSDNIEFDGINRSVASKYQREVAGNNINPNVNKRKGKSLRQRIKEDIMDSRGIIADINSKGVHLRMNDYYETNKNKEDKPMYYLYEPGDEVNIGKQINGNDYMFANEHL